MKAFVTGGTGFIGSHLAEALIENPEWDEVKCLVRSSDKWLEGKTTPKLKVIFIPLKPLNRRWRMLTPFSISQQLLKPHTARVRLCQCGSY
jgi:nucleoside-diphosphate-sugar epimerase